MKLLLVGDPHVRPEDIPECERLATFVLETAIKTEPDYIVVLGDLHHTHSLVHVEVLDFWRRTFALWAEKTRVLCLVGNHDMSSDSSIKAHALMAYPNVRVIDEPTPLAKDSPILLVPYQHSREDFVRVCNQWADRPLAICHQTFNGAQYENGFYAKDGVDPDSIPQRNVISGHIHSRQDFGKVHYLGSPRWMTVSDANQAKFLALIDVAPDGSWQTELFSTQGPCTAIQHLEDTPENTIPDLLDPDTKYIIDIRGPAAFIEERKKTWSGKARVRTFYTDKALPRVKESEGIGHAFRRFYAGYKPRFGTSQYTLNVLTRERLDV